MPTAPMNEVRATLAPYHDMIRQVVHDAWMEVRSITAYRYDAGLGAFSYRRTIANLMFDAIAKRASLAFQDEPGIHIRAEAQTVKFFARGDVLFRFKKGDATKLGCNIRTQAVLAFIDADAVMPGLPPETAKVEVIWEPNEIWTEVEHVSVVARDGRRLVWSYSLDAEADGLSVIPFPTPIAPEVNDPPLVKPKPVAKPDTGEDKK